MTIAPWNEQIFEFGEIRYNQFSIDYKPTKPYLFGYAWSNRMTGLLDLGNQHPEFTVGYSIGSHAGEWNSGAASDLGWTVATPLEAMELHPGGQGLSAQAQSLLDVDAPNVDLTVLKQSEQPGRGWIVRLVETAGHATDTTLHSGLLPIDRAWDASIAEDDRAPLPVQEHRVHVHLLPYGMVTVRLMTGNTPDRVADLKASALTGEKTKLSWSPVVGRSYNIYRSDDPDDPPTANTLVARTTQAEFADDHLMPMGTYYYRVAAVNSDNVQGSVSERVSVTTNEANVEPPPPVADVVTIALTGDRRMVAWQESTATDVREYRIYRSEGKEFDAAHATLMNTQTPSGFSVETFIDQNYDTEKTYRYFVVPVDWAGNHQAFP